MAYAVIEIKYKIQVYRTDQGKIPFIDWLEDISDTRTKQKIQVSIDRIALGNLGKTRSLGEGIHEIKINYGPGYRVYFGREGDSLVILLCGGDKSRQNEDIKKAKKYWKDFKRKR